MNIRFVIALGLHYLFLFPNKINQNVPVKVLVNERRHIIIKSTQSVGWNHLCMLRSRNAKIIAIPFHLHLKPFLHNFILRFANYLIAI